MTQPKRSAGRRSILFAAAVAAASISISQPQALGTEASEVSAVSGSAFGYYSNVSLVGGPAAARGPLGTTGCDAESSTACSPSASLPSTGGSHAAADVDGASAQYGRAAFFEAASMAVSTEGATGVAGAVTSTASAGAVGPGPFTAEAASSTCTASAASVSASTAIGNGRLVTKTDATTGGPVATEAIAPVPAANTTYSGTLDHLGESFTAVVNEQSTNADGSITVNALHLYLLGPIAVGDLIVGQSVCGVTSAAAADAAPSPDTTAMAPPNVEAAAPAPQTVDPGTQRAAVVAAAATPAALPAAPPSGGSGAFGFFAEVSLFGGPAAPRGPSPNVVLPTGGSATPVTGTAATGDVRYGPGILFTSGPITATTQGTAASSTSKVEIQNVNTSGVEVFTAAGLNSTCTGATGSTTVTGGTLRTSEGNPDVDGDDTNVPVPANPAPNTRFSGKIEGVGDSFEAIFNEQVVSGGGITVTAYHLRLLGPTAIGDLFIGQSRCAATATGTGTGSPGAGGTGTGGTGTAAGGTGAGAGAGTPSAGTAGAAGAGGTGGTQQARPAMATTGFGGFGTLMFGLTLLLLGAAASIGGARLRMTAGTAG